LVLIFALDFEVESEFCSPRIDARSVPIKRDQTDRYEILLAGSIRRESAALLECGGLRAVCVRRGGPPHSKKSSLSANLNL
jgi:hypothetical protein